MGEIISIILCQQMIIEFYRDTKFYGEMIEEYNRDLYIDTLSGMKARGTT